MTLAMWLTLVASAQASEGVSSYFGGSGTLGGQFSTPAGNAINNATGDVYVADPDNNRIERFDSTGGFVSAWGLDVVQPGGTGEVSTPVSEQQTLKLLPIGGAAVTGGTFTLGFDGQTTAPIAFDATAAGVDGALEALSTIGAGNVSVSGTDGGPWTITFTGALANTDVPDLVGDAGGFGCALPTTPCVTGSPGTFFVVASVSTTVQGGLTPGVEVCTVASECQAGSISAAMGGALNAPQGVAVDQASGAVYVTDQGNSRVQKFSATGAFEWAAGWDAITDGSGSDPGGITTFQTCTVAGDCKQALAGPEAGEFGTPVGYPAVDPVDGSVYVADPASQRVQRLSSAGAFLGASGWDVVPAGQPGDSGAGLETCPATAADTAGACQAGTPGSGSGQFALGTPTRVAVDAGGSVYTVEPTDGFRVQKLSPDLSSASVVAPATGADAGDAPTDVAVDPSDNHVYVVKGVHPGDGAPPASTPERRVLELDSLGLLSDTHMPGAGIDSVNGLAVNATTKRLYVSSTTVAPRIYVLEDVAAPSATIAPASDVTDSSATFTGTVNPHGASQPAQQTGYRFEYSRGATNTWHRLPSSDVDAGAGDGDVAVTTGVSGLLAHSEYHVRLVAAKAFGGGVTTSSEVVFTTDAATPEVATAQTYQFGPTSAVLTGTVNPHGLPTTYYFQYGTDTGYGTSAPGSQDADAGQGSLSRAFTQQIIDLQPNTTYHYRLVAHSDAGASTGADASFTTGGVTGPVSAVDNRAYELVSPTDTGGVPVLHVYAPAVDGDHVAFDAFQAFPGATNPNADELMSSRTATGWTSQHIGPPINPAKTYGLEDDDHVVDLSDDGAVAFFDLTQNLDPNDRNQNEADHHDVDVYARRSDGTFAWLSAPAALPATDIRQRVSYIGRSDDSSHVLMQARQPLLPQDPHVPLGSANEGGGIYESVNGVLHFVNILPDGTVSEFGGDAVSAGSGIGRLISDDGSRIFFSSCTESGCDLQGVGAGALQLFVRKNADQPPSPLDGAGHCTVSADACTVMVSASQRSVPDTRRGALFVGASRDGSRVFFLSTERLTDDANTGSDTGLGQDLYEFDVNDGSLHDLSVDPNAADVNGARVGATGSEETANQGNGVVAVSDDGSRVYFEAAAKLTDAPNPVGAVASADAQNLYVSHAGVVSFVAGLAPTDLFAWDQKSGLTVAAPALSADGRYLLFRSSAALVPGSQTGGLAQAWLFDQTASTLRCLSCTPAGTPANTSSAVFSSESQPYLQRHDAVTSDGRAAFSTYDPLVPADVNGRSDVYEYAGGRVHLISSGVSQANAGITGGLVAGGRDLFFTTSEVLAPGAAPGAVKLYDARENGGFPGADPDRLVVPCSADACQGAWTPAPVVPGPGAGDQAAAVAVGAPRFSVARVSAAQRKRLTATGRLSLSVTASEGGSLRLLATGTVASKTVAIAKASTTLRAAGTAHLLLKLSKAARAQLKKAGKLAVRLSVTYSKAAVSQTATLKLTQPKPKQAAKKPAKKKASAKRAASAEQGGRS